MSSCFSFHFLAHLSQRLIGELIVYGGIRRPFVVVRRRREHFQTTSPLKPLGRFFSYITYSIYRQGGRNNCVFVPMIRTLVAMATYSFHRLIMGKEEIDNFFLSQWRYLDFFSQKCLLSSPLRFI